MKTMCPPGYHHNGFVATHALYPCKCILICFLNEKALRYLLCSDAWHIAFVLLSSLKKNCQLLKSWKMSHKLLHLRSI